MKKKVINEGKSFRLKGISMRITARSVSKALREPKKCRVCKKKMQKPLGYLCREHLSYGRTKDKVKEKKQSGRIMHENATVEELIDVYKDLL